LVVVKARMAAVVLVSGLVWVLELALSVSGVGVGSGVGSGAGVGSVGAASSAKAYAAKDKENIIETKMANNFLFVMVSALYYCPACL